MATTYIQMDRGTPHGAANAACLRMARDARDGLKNQLALLATMIDGDASNISHFDLMVTQVGYGGWVANNAVTDAQRAAAKASWDELNSLYAKLSATSSGDVTGAAITQACAKHGV